MAVYQRRSNDSLDPASRPGVRESLPFILVGLCQAFLFLAVALFPHRVLFELGLLFLLATPALVFRFVLTHLGRNES